MPYLPHTVHVAALDPLSPHFVRVTFEADSLADLGWDGPDQRIKLVFPAEGQDAVAVPGGSDWYAAWRGMPDDARPPMRTYTTRYADPAGRRLIVDFVSHGDTGPATRWVNRAAIGDRIVVIAPDGSGDNGGYEWHPGRATAFLVVADESAVPAAAAILESLPADAVGAAYLEVPARADRLELSVPAGVAVTWLARDESAAAAHGELLDAAVRAGAEAWRSSGAVAATPDDVESEPDSGELLWEVPEAPADAGLYAWLAGEAGVITGLRRHLVRDLGVDRRRVAFMGYWKIGRAEN
jgi:NADPH-dependent ferric siderophore reductase